MKRSINMAECCTSKLTAETTGIEIKEGRAVTSYHNLYPAIFVVVTADMRFFRETMQLVIQK